MKPSLRLLLSAFCLALLCGCGSTRLEQGGAYAPATNGVATAEADLPFYLTDAAFDAAWSSLDVVFKLEETNRAALWKVNPGIKHTLDKIRPQAAALWRDYAVARAAYVRNPVPANLGPLQSALAHLGQLIPVAQAVLTQVNP